jgi:RND family efflux transporter MFP subunit
VKAKLLVPILLLIAAFGGASVLLATRAPFQPSQPQPVPTAVRVVDVAPQPVRLKVHSQGTVQPRVETELVPEVAGNVVWVSPNLVPGGYFEAAETLLRIDDRDYDAAVRRARATLTRAEAERRHARFEYERAEDLHGRQLISRSDLEAALRTVTVADATVEDARLALETAERDFARTIIRAPFAGFVRSEQIDAGQFVSRGTSVATIYAADYVEIRLPIADREFAYLNVPVARRGEIDEQAAPPVRVAAQLAGLAQTWNGKLVRTEAEIDPGSRMIYAVARVRATEQHPPPPVGLFVQAEIEGIAVDNVVVLPRAAVREGGRVLVVDHENRLRFRDVEVLRIYREDAFVQGGLRPGERVVVSAIQTVVEGMPVQPIVDAPEGVLLQ